MPNVTRIGKGLGQVVVVSLPALFMLLWTLDAALVPGADVFIVALIQLIFIAIYVGYIYWQAPT